MQIPSMTMEVNSKNIKVRINTHQVTTITLYIYMIHTSTTMDHDVYFSYHVIIELYME